MLRLQSPVFKNLTHGRAIVSCAALIQTPLHASRPVAWPNVSVFWRNSKRHIHDYLPTSFQVPAPKYGGPKASNLKRLCKFCFLNMGKAKPFP